MQVVVDIADEQVEQHATPQLPHVLDRMHAMGANGVCNFYIGALLIARRL